MYYFRITFLLLFIIIANTGLAQSSYSFDNFITYKFKSYTGSLDNKTLYYMTNSRDNSYYVKIEHIDSLNLELEFVVQDKLWTKQQLKKEDFSKAENINLICDGSLIFENDFKYKTKDYAYKNLNDTLLDSIKLISYKLEYTGKRQRKKSFPVGSNHYIIKDSTQFHLPLLTHATEFEEWKKERNIPNGIFKEKIFYDYKDRLKYKYILQNIHQINKSLIVPDNCLNP